MTRFYDLWRSHFDLPPGEQQALVSSRFPSVVAETPLHLWSPTEVKRPLDGWVIGVALYSVGDMKLLDLIEDAAGMSGQQVDVFDVLECRTGDDFERRIPGVGKVLQTPVVGLWRDGKLVEKATGHAARLLIAREHLLNETDLNDLWSTDLSRPA